MTLNNLLPALRDHLNAEITCHRSLLLNLEAQQREVVANHIAVYAELVDKCDPLLVEQARLRKAREKILTGLAVVLDRPGKAIALGDVVAMVGEPWRGELSARHLVLKDTLLKLRVVQERNQALVRQGLGFVRDLVGALTGEPTQGAYDRRGHDGGRVGNGKLVNIAG